MQSIRKLPYLITVKAPKNSGKMFVLVESSEGVALNGGRIIRPSRTATMTRKCPKCHLYYREKVLAQWKLTLTLETLEKYPELATPGNARKLAKIVNEFVNNKKERDIILEKEVTNMERHVEPLCDRCHGTGWVEDGSDGRGVLWLGVVLTY